MDTKLVCVLLYIVETVQKSGKDAVSVTLTPLMAASQCGHVEMVRELLRSKANVDVKLTSTRWTALMLACLNNRVRHATPIFLMIIARPAWKIWIHLLSLMILYLVIVLEC